MKRWNTSSALWLGTLAVTATLLLTAPPVAANGPGNSDFGQSHDVIPTPEPATLALIALGGGAAALVRYRKSRKK